MSSAPSFTVVVGATADISIPLCPTEVEYGAPHVSVAGPAYPHHHQQQPPPQAGPQPSGSGSGAQAAAAAARQRALLRDAYSDDEEAEAAIAYAEAHRAAAHRAPSPVPNPPQAHVYAREQSVELSNCPICQLNVSALAMDAAEEHLRQCLDGDGATVLSCPVCELRLEGMDSKLREKHVDDCCNGGVGGTATERNREHAGECPSMIRKLRRQRLTSRASHRVLCRRQNSAARSHQSRHRRGASRQVARRSLSDPCFLPRSAASASTTSRPTFS